MISELRVRQALASSIYFDPCFPLFPLPFLLSLSPSHLTFHLRGLLPASLSPLKAVEFHEEEEEALRTLGCIS